MTSCAVGEILQGIITGICFLLCQPGLLSTLLCRGIVGTAAEPQWDMSQLIVTLCQDRGALLSPQAYHLACLLGAFQGAEGFSPVFFFPKMKRLIVCQSNYAVVLA